MKSNKITLSANERNALNAVFDTLFPSIKNQAENQLFWETKGSDLDIATSILDLAENLELEQQKELQQLFSLLASKLAGLTGLLGFKSFDELNAEERESLLQKWSTSKIPQLRKAFVTLKNLTGFIYLGKIQDGGNHNWQGLLYEGPLAGQVDERKALACLHINNKNDLSCDTLIIGSGAGGSVVAAELAKRGEQVIIVEKGPYVQPAEMNQLEFPMVKKLYEKQGALTTIDGGTSIFAGSCVGGGTTVNWAGSFRTPDYVLHEWATEHQNTHFIDSEYSSCFEFIENRTGVNSNDTNHNFQNTALLKGSEQLGYATKIVPRNIVHSDHPDFFKRQGYMGLGDPFSHKQSALITFLEDACEHGAKILADTEIENIALKNGKAIGAYGSQQTPNGQSKIFINAKRVVVACGAIHSPALLMRSGLSHPQLGKNLCLHPVMVVIGAYQQKSQSWYGPMMSVVNDTFCRLDGNFGFKIETPPTHLAMLGLALPWQSGKQMKELLLKAPYTAGFLVLCREKYGGQIKLSKRKKPIIHYKLNPYDLKHLLRGVEACAKIHEAAGAKHIGILHNQFEFYDTKTNQLNEYIQRNLQKKWASNYFPLFCAHQMSSCRMGGDNKRHPVQPDGQFRGIKNLYVADGSALPHASGANPMLSIQALARYIASNMA